MEIYVLYEQLPHLIGITANLAEEDATHCAEIFVTRLCTALHSQLLYAPPHFSKK
jgi:hypothetical protein